MEISTITQAVDRLAEVGYGLILLSGRMQQCPYMGDKPWPELFEAAEAELGKLQEALNVYDRLTKPEEASVAIVHPDEHQLDIEDGTVSFEAYRAKKELA